MRKKKVILIQLISSVESAIASTSMYIPLALGLLKAQAIKEKLCPQYFDIEILDVQKSLNYGEARLVKYLIDNKPDIIGFSCFGWNVLKNSYIAKKVKEILPNTVVFFGGPEAGPRGIDILEKNDYVDIVINGEGEFSFVEVLQWMLNKKSLSEIDGITYRENNEIKKNIDRAPIEDLDSIASPFLYNTLKLHEYNQIIVETSRGCPFRCSYCYYGAGRKRVKYFSLDRVRKELEIIKMQNGPRDCEFIDPTFNIPGRLEEIFKMIKEVNSDKYFRFRIEANPEFITEEQIEMFKEMNVTEVEIGIQSTDKDELKAINRVFHEDKVTANIKLLEKSGLPVFYHLIIGLPNQTKESFKRSCEYLRELGVGSKVQAFLLQVLPGTELRKKSEELGVYFKDRAPYFVEETSKLSNDDIQELMARRNEFLLGKPEEKSTNENIVIPELNLLRYNSLLNTDYNNINHVSKIFKYDEADKIDEELKSKTLSRYIVEEELLKNSENIDKIPNNFTSVFNQVYFRLNNEEINIDSICNVISKIFEKNPFACADLVFDGDYVISNDEVFKIYKTLANVFKSFGFIEMGRTRKRIELLSLFTFSEENIKKASQLSNYVQVVYKVKLNENTDVLSILKSFEKYNLQAVVFVSEEITNWDIVVSKLEDIYEFSKRNYYVFFDDIMLQQFYIKNYLYRKVKFSKGLEFPFGYHCGEVSLVLSNKELKLKIADKYPFD